MVPMSNRAMFAPAVLEAVVSNTSEIRGAHGFAHVSGPIPATPLQGLPVTAVHCPPNTIIVYSPLVGRVVTMLTSYGSITCLIFCVTRSRYACRFERFAFQGGTVPPSGTMR